MEQIRNINQIEELIKSKDIFILMVGSASCGPCRDIKMKLSNYLDEHSEISGAYLASEKFIQYCASHSIFMVPTIIVYVKGKEAIRKIRNFSFLELINEIERFKSIIE